MNHSKTFLYAITAAILTGAQVYGQTATATLSGTVVDPADKLVSEVALTLINADTALERHGKTGSQGEFAFPFVAPGRYMLRAHRDGFAPGQLNDISLNVGENVSIRIALKLGSNQESITVIEDASRIQEAATVGTVINRQFVENLPLNGPSIQALVALAPGVVDTPADQAFQGVQCEWTEVYGELLHHRRSGR
jgi:hypothetical protein